MYSRLSLGPIVIQIILCLAVVKLLGACVEEASKLQTLASGVSKDTSVESVKSMIHAAKHVLLRIIYLGIWSKVHQPILPFFEYVARERASRVADQVLSVECRV